MSPGVRLADDAAWVEDDGTVYAARLPDGPPLILEDALALVWHAALESRTEAEVCARVAERTHQSAEVVAPEVLDFVDSLVRAGVLVRAAPGS